MSAVCAWRKLTLRGSPRRRCRRWRRWAWRVEGRIPVIPSPLPSPPVRSPLISALLRQDEKPRASGWYCDKPVCDGKAHEGWPENHSRTSQRPPDGRWLVWLFSGGRGTGKTRAGAEWVNDQVWNQGKRRIALVARTPADARDVMIWGDSGIMACSDPDRIPRHEPTKRCVVWPNGAEAYTYSAAAPDQLRGPQHDCAWGDEAAAWMDARRGDALGTSWSNLILGLRIGKDPRVLLTTTPKRVKLIRE